MNSSLWQSAENKSNKTTVLDDTRDAVSDFKNVDSHDALTPTTLFMASSLSDSLLLSSISLRSSFLRTDRQTDRIVTDSQCGRHYIRHSQRCWDDFTNQFQQLELDQRYCERSV